MNAVAAKELKRRGIAAVDPLVKEGGAAYILKNNRPSYVVLTEKRYSTLLRAEEEAAVERIRKSLADVKAGRVRRYKSAASLIRELDLED